MIIGLQGSDFVGFFAGLIFLLMAFGAEAFVIRSFKKSMYMEMLIDSAFENGLYSKLEPVLSSISEIGVNVTDIEKRMDQMSFKLEELNTHDAARQGAPMNDFILKSIFAVNVTLGVIIFLSLNPLGGIHFILTAVYLIWWFLITSEFNLYNNVQAWYYCFAIIIFVPMATILLNAFFNLYVMMALLFSGIAIFSVIYYMWSMYITKGELPFNLHNEVKQGLGEIQKNNPGRKSRRSDL